MTAQTAQAEIIFARTLQALDEIEAPDAFSALDEALASIPDAAPLAICREVGKSINTDQHAARSREKMKALIALGVASRADAARGVAPGVAPLVSKGEHALTTHTPTSADPTRLHVPANTNTPKRRPSLRKPVSAPLRPGTFTHKTTVRDDPHGFSHVVERRTDPRWRDLDERGVLEASFDFLSARGSVSDFTLDLSPAIEKEALLKPNAAGWLRARIAHALKKHFGTHAPEFVFALDAPEKGRPRLHLHGFASVSPEFHAQLVAALKAAGGPWDSKRGSRHQVDVGIARTRSWASYATRNRDCVRSLVKGSIIAGTRAVSAGAREVFEAWRASRLQAEDKSLFDLSFRSLLFYFRISKYYYCNGSRAARESGC